MQCWKVSTDIKFLISTSGNDWLHTMSVLMGSLEIAYTQSSRTTVGLINMRFSKLQILFAQSYWMQQCCYLCLCIYCIVYVRVCGGGGWGG